jgi:hypothetical protein
MMSIWIIDNPVANAVKPGATASLRGGGRR